MILISPNIAYMYSVFYAMIALSFFSVGFLIFRRDTKKLSNIFFLLTGVALGLFAFSFIVRLEGYHLFSPETFNMTLPYLTGMHAPLLAVIFVLTFTQQKIHISRTSLLVALVPYTVLLWVLFLFPSNIIRMETDRHFILNPFYWLFVLYIATYFLLSLYLLIKRYKASAGVFKTILRSIIYVTALSFFSVVCVVTLYIFYKDLGLILLESLFLFLVFLYIGFKKMQYHRWNTKPFFVEIFIFLVVIVLVAQLFLADSVSAAAANGVILTLFILSGYFLIKNVHRELSAKTKIERLVKDLTEVNEKLQMLDRRKSEFVKISAHHLKAPLTAIKGYASMILEGSFGENINGEARQAIQNIFDSSERLVAIIKDFMDISNIESGKMEYVFGAVDMKKLIEGVLEEMHLTIKKSGLDVSFNTDEITGYEIMADSGKVRQVISNLVDNSIKYTPKGSVHLFLKKNKRHGKILLTITDTGVGMSKETIDRLFEKFSRADDANKVNTGGSGLGLYVAKEIMKKHEAHIWVESPGEGKGSTFHLEFEMKKEVELSK